MTALYTWGYQFGAFVERYKMVLLFSLSLVFPLAAFALSILKPAVGLSFFSFICHQQPERSFGALPLCSRCLGQFIGFSIGGLFLPAFSRHFSKKFMLVGLLTSLLVLGLGLISPFLDTNYIRLVLGSAVGAGFALLIKSILK